MRLATRDDALSARAFRRTRVPAQIFADHGHKLVEKPMKQDELLSVIPQYDGLIVRSGVKVRG